MSGKHWIRMRTQMSENDITIKVRGLTKHFDDFPAVDGIDFEVYRGIWRKKKGVRNLFRVGCPGCGPGGPPAGGC